MALTKKDTELLNKIFDEKVKSVFAVSGMFRDREKNKFQQTESRLRAYKDLKVNIEKYKLDIQDLKIEKIPGRSRDITRYSATGGGEQWTPEQIQLARIYNLEMKICRDEAEIREIELALEAISNDKYYSVISYKYFDGMEDEEIAELINCSDKTVSRNKSRLVRRLSIKLYGADALNG